MSGRKLTEDLIKDLLSLVAELQKGVTTLNSKEDDQQKCKWSRDENEEEHEADTNCDGKRQHTDKQKDCNRNVDEAESGEKVLTEQTLQALQGGQNFLKRCLTQD